MEIGMAEASGEFQIDDWDEQTLESLAGGARLARARALQSFQGDLEAQAVVEFLVLYRGDGTATYVGMARLIGRISEHAGRFVLQVEGTFNGNQACATWRVLEGSAEGSLAGLAGNGGFSAERGGEGRWTLDYSLPNES
jgi:hypothetical protein